MLQLTRDLYTNKNVWLSLSHSFAQKNATGTAEFDLVRTDGDFITLNAGALLVLTLWTTGKKIPDKFYIPEYKIEEFRSILITLRNLKADKAYIRDGELTDIAKPATLYYRLFQNSKRFADFYFVENNFNGDKAINISIEVTSNVYFLYDSNVDDLIDIIPTPADIVKYKQSAAELYYTENLHKKTLQHIDELFAKMSSGKHVNIETPVKEELKKDEPKKAEPKTITRVDRTSVTKPVETVEVIPAKVTESKVVIPPVETSVEKTEIPASKSGYDYNNLLEDE